MVIHHPHGIVETQLTDIRWQGYAITTLCKGSTDTFLRKTSILNQCLTTEIRFQKQLFVLNQITKAKEKLFVGEFGEVGNAQFRSCSTFIRFNLNLILFLQFLLIRQCLVNLIYENTVFLLDKAPLSENIDGESQNQQSQDGNGNTDSRHQTILGTLLNNLSLLALRVVDGCKLC